MESCAIVRKRWGSNTTATFARISIEYNTNKVTTWIQTCFLRLVTGAIQANSTFCINTYNYLKRLKYGVILNFDCPTSNNLRIIPLRTTFHGSVVSLLTVLNLFIVRVKTFSIKASWMDNWESQYIPDREIIVNP